MDPTVTLQGSIPYSDEKAELTYGLRVPFANGKPKSLWGEYTTTSKGWDMSTRVDTELNKSSLLNMECSAEHVEEDVAVTFCASTGGSSTLKSIELRKAFSSDNSKNDKIMIQPRWDMTDKTRDIKVTFQGANSSVQYITSNDSNNNNSKIQYSRNIGANHKITQSLGNNGLFGLEYVIGLDNDDESNTIRASIQNDTVDLEWEEDNWCANVRIPLLGNAVEGMLIGVKREVHF